MDKTYRYLMTFSILIFCIVTPCLILVFTGTATPFIYSFAVDLYDRIYIGTKNEICVYEDGVPIKSIEPRTSRDYRFTINDNGNILLSTATYVHIMDLEGNVLSTHEDLGADMFNQIEYTKKKYISANGDVYKMVGEFGLTRIIKNDIEVVYQISNLSFAVKILIPACTIALFMFVLWGFIQVKKLGSSFTT